MRKELYTRGERETLEAAVQLARRLGPGDVVAFTGGLGAGKTAFTRGLAQGVGSPAPVSSPTFAIMNEYRGGRLTLYHFDLYRIADEDDLYDTGFFDCLADPNAVLAVEWSENVPQAIPAGAYHVRIEPLGGDERRITITQDGDGNENEANEDSGA